MIIFLSILLTLVLLFFGLAYAISKAPWGTDGIDCSALTLQQDFYEESAFSLFKDESLTFLQACAMFLFVLFFRTVLYFRKRSHPEDFL